MALVNCNECGKEISDKAENCPNCGNPINGDGRTQKVEVISAPNKEGCFLQTMNAGCMVIAIVLIIIVLIIIFSAL